MVGGLPAAHALLWVLRGGRRGRRGRRVRAGAGARPRAFALIGAALAGCSAAYLAAGLALGLLEPRRLDELGAGLVARLRRRWAPCGCPTRAPTRGRRSCSSCSAPCC